MFIFSCRRSRTPPCQPPSFSKELAPASRLFLANTGPSLLREGPAGRRFSFVSSARAGFRSHLEDRLLQRPLQSKNREVLLHHEDVAGSRRAPLTGITCTDKWTCEQVWRSTPHLQAPGPICKKRNALWGWANSKLLEPKWPAPDIPGVQAFRS